MHHPTDRITHTTALVTPVVEHWLEREIAQWVHPMKDRSDDPSHHLRTPIPHGATSRSKKKKKKKKKKKLNSYLKGANENIVLINTSHMPIKHKVPTTPLSFCALID